MRFYTPTRKSWHDDNGIHKSHLTKRRDFFDAKLQSRNNYIKQIGEGCGYRYYDKITKARAYLNSAGMYDSLSHINSLYIFFHPSLTCEICIINLLWEPPVDERHYRSSEVRTDLSDAVEKRKKERNKEQRSVYTIRWSKQNSVNTLFKSLRTLT